MGLMDRDYMGESVEQRAAKHQENKDRAKRTARLWELYAKKHKTIFDKIEIAIIERKNK